MENTIRIAAIQNRSEPGTYADNLENAGFLVEQAAKNNAQLVILPELFATGYSANEAIFSMGETLTGPTLSWLKEQSRQHKIFLGGGVPLFENDHLYNRFYLCDPNGEVCGYAQKDNGEAYCFKRGEGAYLIDTSLGRLGVSICGDTHYSYIVETLQSLEIDILIMPHAWPTMQTGGQDEWEFSMTISQMLKVPIVFVNGVGKMQPMQGIFGKFMTPEKFALRGRSCMIDATRKMLGSLDDQPGILIRDVALGKSSNEKPVIPNYAGWVHPGSKLLRKVIIPFDVWMGKRVYERNRLKFR